MPTVKKFLKILALVTVGLVFVIVGMVLIDLLLLTIMAALASALSLPWIGDIDRIWVILFAVILMPKGWIWNLLGWNKPYVCHATDVFNAPVGEVWDMYRLRPRKDYHSVTMPTVVAVPGTRDEFDLLLDERLTKDGDMPMAIKMKVDELIENFYIRMHCTNKESLPLFGKDLVDTEIWMDDLGDGTTRVTYAENLSRLTWVAALAFLFLNPAKDGLKQVKSRVEGTEDTSWMTRSMNNVGPNGEATGEANQTLVMVMVAATLVVSAMAMGTVWLVMSLAS